MIVSATTRTRRAVAALAAAAALVLGAATGASAARVTDAAPQVVADVRASTYPWSPDPVVGELFDVTSEGWSGDVPVGTSTVTTMTITARQDLVLRPGNWHPGYGDFDFALSGTCPRNLFGSARMAPGDTCTVTWTIHPVELRAGSTAWFFSATPVDPAGVATGESVHGRHDLSFMTHVFLSEKVDFGPVAVGNSVTRPVTIRNVSPVDALLVVDAPDAPVDLPDRPVDPVLVPAGESLTLDAVYTPTWADDELISRAWFHTTLPGSDSRMTGIVRFSGSGVAPVVEPTDPPVDPTDPPVDPTGPVNPFDPSWPIVEVGPLLAPGVYPTVPVDPIDPILPIVDVGPLLAPGLDPTVPMDPTGSTVPIVDVEVPLIPGLDPSGAGRTDAPSAAAVSAEPTPDVVTVPADAEAGAGALATTGGGWTTLVLGALTLLSSGLVLRTWARARSARDGARAVL
ncbi:hypothetical protein ASG53_01805 [Sanguibacter sp. Leaf3]|nr:hypothetical protein ASG53_01805 [Sanguibacter sp. Leaf3]